MHLVWPNFVFMTASIGWIVVAHRYPHRVYGDHQPPPGIVSRKLTPWILGIIAAGNGVLWLLPLWR